MTDRYLRNGPQNDYYERSPQTAHDYGAGRDYTYSSARDYAAAGIDRTPRRRRYGDGPSAEYRGSYWDDGRRSADYERGFIERAGDEVRSWFGDEEAERRRDFDRRREAMHDDHYRRWRDARIDEFDRDYDEYRRENAERFAREFDSWRGERRGQREGLRRVTEHMEVVGSDGQHLGTVDKVRGDRILLTKSDPDAGGHHHSIPSRWIDSVDERVTLTKAAEEARDHWREEDQRTAMRWEEGAPAAHILDRAFAGTY